MSAFSDQNASKSAAIAALSWLVWDTLVHLDIEVEYVWRRPRSWISSIYMGVRYITILYLGTIVYFMTHDVMQWHDCHAWHIAENVFSIALNIAVELILMMRLYALYNDKRIVRGSLATLFVLGNLAIVGATLNEAVETAKGKLLSPGLPSETSSSDPQALSHCVIAAPTTQFLVCWIVPLVFETVLFALTLAVLPRRLSGILAHSVLDILIRDGTWAFAIIFAVLAVNVVINAVGDSLGPSTEVIVTISYCTSATTLSHAIYVYVLMVEKLVLQYPVILSMSHCLEPATVFVVEYCQLFTGVSG